MKDEESYTTKQARLSYLRKIKESEARLIDNKLGATTSDGKFNYEFMLMMNKTRDLLHTTKSLDEKEEDFTNMRDNNDLTIGDIQ